MRVINTEQVNLLDHGFVRLDDFMADDLSVVNSARVSFGKRVAILDPKDELLIKYLMKNKHGTPFEHNAFRFHVRAPIFVFREWQRHRIGSFNEMSARYMQLAAEWYIPEVQYVRQRVGKPGHYTYECVGQEIAEKFRINLHTSCTRAYSDYVLALERRIAPEQARMFLHVNHYSEMYWTVNARSLMNFINLRNASSAQWEIQQFAIEVEKRFMECMPITHNAFIENKRIAP